MHLGLSAKTILLDAVRALVQFLLRYFHQLEVRGQRNVPPSGAVVLISNHGSYYDPVIIGGVLRRRVCFMAWRGIFSWPVVSWLARAAGAFPIDLQRRHDLDAYHVALDLLKGGEVLGIFPEGGREPGPFMESVKLGGLQIAVRGGAPIVPVSIVGIHDIWPRRRRTPQPSKIAITFHPPIPMPAKSFANWREERAFLEGLMKQVQGVINTEIAARLREYAKEGYIGASIRRFQLTEGKTGDILQRQ